MLKALIEREKREGFFSILVSDRFAGAALSCRFPLHFNASPAARPLKWNHGWFQPQAGQMHGGKDARVKSQGAGTDPDWR